MPLFDSTPVACCDGCRIMAPDHGLIKNARTGQIEESVDSTSKTVN
ncbi:hypothetical protein D3OALGB2SA_521 [Olavius algarvensis associated proteobacterium Delta 3]|nr:hypothetical protein D3OALGB2SA_521 [Olavius algarvensis associated proteobacterium Delta 3]